MKFELRARDKRALMGLALAVGAYLLASQLIVPAYDRIKSDSAGVSQKENELRRYRRALISRDHYAQLLEQVRKSVGEGEARLIRGDNPSLASVELQTMVEEAARKIEIALPQRTMTSPKKKDDYYNEITLTLSFESTPNQLASFLDELRTAPKVLTVKSIQVAPVTPAQETPPKGELKKTLKTNVTLAALLSSPPTGGKRP